MENSIPNATKVASKWALIYVLASIVLTYLFQILNIEQNSAVQYIGYLPFIAFLLLTQKEYRDQLSGFLSFGQGFSAGFRFSVFAGLLLAIFMYIYLGILSPQVLEKAMNQQQAKLEQQGLSQEQIDKGMEIAKKYGTLFGAFGAAIGSAVLGAIVSLIGAAIFKKEKSILDIENETLSENNI
jgi:hypothetical protein